MFHSLIIGRKKFGS